MSTDHAIMLLGAAIHVMENWTAYERPLPHALSLLREARGNLETAPAQSVDHAGVCRFLACLRESAGSGYVTSEGETGDTYILDGVWSREELRAAILAALPTVRK